MIFPSKYAYTAGISKMWFRTGKLKCDSKWSRNHKKKFAVEWIKLKKISKNISSNVYFKLVLMYNSKIE